MLSIRSVKTKKESCQPMSIPIHRLAESFFYFAISNITRSVSALFFVIANSFVVTIGSLVSNSIGAGARNELFPICCKVLKWGYAVGISLVGVVLFCHR